MAFLGTVIDRAEPVLAPGGLGRRRFEQDVPVLVARPRFPGEPEAEVLFHEPADVRRRGYVRPPEAVDFIPAESGFQLGKDVFDFHVKSRGLPLPAEFLLCFEQLVVFHDK